MTLIYQAYGRPEIVRQAAFSILTFLRWGTGERVLVYSDQAEFLGTFFEGFPSVEIVPVTEAQLRQWRGAIDFVHRVKIEVLLDACRRSKGSIVYLDGDTVFLKNPKDMLQLMSPGQQLMHVCESRLDQARDPLTKKIAHFCRKESFNLKRGIVSVPLATEMWNAGVIGLHESRLGLLEKILELTDAAYAKYQKHVIEQLAVSYFLQSTGRILPAEPWVLHYWAAKDIWQRRIDRFLEQNLKAATAVPALANFDFSLPAQVAKKAWWEKIF